MRVTPEAPFVSPELALMLLDNMQRNGECIEWTGQKTPYGHGQLYVPVSLRRSEFRIAEFVNHGRWQVFVHRLTYELANGPIPGRLVVCHRCDNPSCINPKHLFLGTYRDNVVDSQTKGRRPVAEWQREAVCSVCQKAYVKRRPAQYLCSRECYGVVRTQEAA